MKAQSIIIFIILVFIGWYGGIEYGERIPFNAAYIIVAMIFSCLVPQAMKHEKEM